MPTTPSLIGTLGDVLSRSLSIARTNLGRRKIAGAASIIFSCCAEHSRTNIIPDALRSATGRANSKSMLSFNLANETLASRHPAIVGPIRRYDWMLLSTPRPRPTMPIAILMARDVSAGNWLLPNDARPSADETMMAGI